MFYVSCCNSNIHAKIKAIRNKFYIQTVGIVIYIRYQQIKLLVSDHIDLIESQIATKSGIICLWIGIGSCLGISIVANFQETNVRIIHFIGAFICFACGTIYFWIQA